MIDRRIFLGAALAAIGCGRRGPSNAASKLVAYLWSQQSDDGGWHSKTYGLMRSGQSLTPFVLEGLLAFYGNNAKPQDKIDRAFAFLDKNTNAEGAIGLSDSATPDYPNYATGLAVSAAARAHRDSSKWVACLRHQQFTEDNGWHRDDAAYGAWGMGGERRTPPEAGHVDLAMTRYVMEGLAAAGVKPEDPTMQKALVYLGRCQNPDGGFFFSTVNLDTNKAGEENGHYRSYGTTTCDGVLSLRAAGVPLSDARIKKAQAWLKENHLESRAPGFDKEPARLGWSDGLRLYYAAAVIRAMPGLPIELPPQREDGSFVNTNNLVKEDDPILASGLVLRCMPT